MIRLVIIYKDGNISGYNFNSILEAEEFTLKNSDKIKRADIQESNKKETRKTIWKVD